ncbi:MAG: SDR family oxidoreductase [Sphingomonadales bacterium]|nr:MAG: SDR family oxidoreductase [Sphingomonadales bacterium]
MQWQRGISGLNRPDGFSPRGACPSARGRPTPASKSGGEGMSGAAEPWIDLTGRAALVTGAASGIGRAAARALAGAGATVLPVDRNQAGVDAVAAGIKEAGGSASSRALDVSDEAQWTATASWIEGSLGRLDILVNAAGVLSTDRVGDSVDQYRATFAVNVEGGLLGMQTALAFMRRQGRGAIVNVSSAATLFGSPNAASYGASKAAIAHFTRSAASQLVGTGLDIRVNSVHPGLVETGMAEQVYAIGEERAGGREALVAAITSGRPARPEEIADLILFLCSERASYISGSEIIIDRAHNA